MADSDFTVIINDDDEDSVNVVQNVNEIEIFEGAATGDHNHDDRYYTESETNALLAAKGQVNSIVAGNATAVDNTNPANPIVSSTLATNGAINLYVDKVNGANTAGKGFSSGSGACATIQYAFDLIPPIVTGDVVVNISGDTYTESPVLRGKSFSGNYTITLQGTKTTIETFTLGSGSVAGAFTLFTTYQKATAVRATGTWTANQRNNKWARFANGDVRLIDITNTGNLTLTGYPLTVAPIAGQDVVIEEPATSITDLQLGTGQRGVVINDINLIFAAGTNQNFFGKYVDVQLNRCAIPYSSGSSLWTNKDDYIYFNDCFMSNIRLFVRKGTFALIMGGKMFRAGNSRLIQVDEGAAVHIGDGLIMDGDGVAGQNAVALTGGAIMNYNGNAPGVSASRQMVTMRKFATANVVNTISAAVNGHWGTVLFGTDIMTKITALPSSVVANKLVDTTGDFITIGVAIGDKVQNLTTFTYALVTAIDSATSLSLDDDIFISTSTRYRIVRGTETSTVADFTQALDANSTIQFRGGVKNAATSQLTVTEASGLAGTRIIVKNNAVVANEVAGIRLIASTNDNFASGYMDAVRINGAASRLDIGTQTLGLQISTDGAVTIPGTNGSVIIPATGNNINLTRNSLNYITATDAAGTLSLGTAAYTTQLQLLANGSASFVGAATIGGALGTVNGQITATRTSAGVGGFALYVTADAQPRWKVTPTALGATLEWGTGAAVADTNLYRLAADTLATDDKFVALGGLKIANSSTTGYVWTAIDTIGNGAWQAASGGGINATNLTATAAPTTVTINSDTGTDAVIAAADATNAGLFLPAEKTKLSGIATGATANTGDVTLTGVQTLTNKRITKRVTTPTLATTTYTIAGDTTDVAKISTAPTANFTIAAPSGTPTDEQKLELVITSGATGYAPTWNAVFMSSTEVALPTTALTASKRTRFGFVYESTLTKWVLIAMTTY